MRQATMDFYEAVAPDYDDEATAAGGLLDANLSTAVTSSILPVRTCLELASGTGNWTRELLDKVSTRLVAVDASPSMHKQSRNKLGSQAVLEYITADIYSLPELGKFDLVFAGFWLSHLDRGFFREFWDYLRTSLTPNGHVAMVDSRTRGVGGSGERRQTPDYRSFRIVKNDYHFHDLSACLETLAWRATIRDIESAWCKSCYQLYAIPIERR